MSTLVEIVYNIIGPIFVVVSASFFLDRRVGIDPTSLSRLVVYLFSPSLVYYSLSHSDLSGDEAGQLIAVVIVMSLLVAGLAWLVAREQGFTVKTQSAFVISATLINAGNYGIPLNRFAFGADGEQRAVIFYVATAFMAYTLGIFVASRGEGSVLHALRNVFYVPLLYAVTLGIFVNMAEIKLPLPLDRSVKLLSDATIPAMLVVLGTQLSRASLRGHLRPILMASSLRLIVAPVIALGLVMLMGMSGLGRQVSIVQAGMPTAVIAGVLSAEFGSDTEFTTGTILISTLCSIVTLTIILALVM